MDKIYYSLIKKGKMTIDDVLPKHKEGVQALLDADK